MLCKLKSTNQVSNKSVLGSNLSYLFVEQYLLLKQSCCVSLRSKANLHVNKTIPALSHNIQLCFITTTEDLLLQLLRQRRQCVYLGLSKKYGIFFTAVV